MPYPPPADALYDGRSKAVWMHGLTEMDGHNTRHLLSLFALIGIPESYLDVGCGTGAMVKTAEKLGVKAYGVDQLVDDSWPKNFFHENLVNKFVVPDGPVSLVTSFEVGEHIFSTAHGTYCSTLCDNLAPGGYLVFTAARPGQMGAGHVACRPSEYWQYEFTLRGCAYNKLMTLHLGLLWSNIISPLNYMWDNVMVFNK